MLEKLRKMLIDAGIDPTVGSIDYWGTELEGVLLDMYDQGVAAEREACAKLCESQIKSYMSKQYTTDPLGGYREKFASKQCAVAIRARGAPSPAFKNYIDDNWAGIV